MISHQVTPQIMRAPPSINQFPNGPRAINGVALQESSAFKAAATVLHLATSGCTAVNSCLPSRAQAVTMSRSSRVPLRDRFPLSRRHADRWQSVGQCSSAQQPSRAVLAIDALIPVARPVQVPGPARLRAPVVAQLAGAVRAYWPHR